MSEAPKSSKWEGKQPRKARDICEAIEQSGRTIGVRHEGSHKTYKIRNRDGRVENLTVVIHKPGQDLKDTNPKVWRKLIKRMTELGIIALLATGGYAATHLPQVMHAVDVAQHALR